MLTPIYNIFGAVMNFFCSITNNNYVLALFLFAVAVKILLLPFSIKQQKNQIKGASLRPKMMAIEKKYAGRNDKATLQKKQNELMAPIIEKANNAVNAVAKEGGYIAIFNTEGDMATSAGLAYFDPEQLTNITEAVAKKLGVEIAK